MNIRGDGVSAFPAQAGKSTGHAVVSPPRAGSSEKERCRRKPAEARGSIPLLPTIFLTINICGEGVKCMPGESPEVCGSRRSPRTMGT